MNFNFNNQRTKFHLGQPIMRHFSTIGLVTLKTDQNDYGLKQDYGIKNVQHNILQNFGGSVVSNKSFSNPNFVNKENPHILSTKLNGNVTFDKQKFVENVSPHLFIQQPKHINCNNKQFEDTVVYQPISDKLSSQSSTQNIVNTSAMPAPISNDFSVKTMKKKRNKKNRKNSKVHHRQDLSPVEPNLNTKHSITSKKYKSLCSAPKRIKKEPETKVRYRGKSKKDKPWHKISLDMEIMECDETSATTPDDIEETSNDQNNCIINKSCPIEILSTNCKNIISEAISFSISPCADILRNLSTSNSSSDLSSMSPSSPAIRRLRLPSECDSEDSFIVFCDDSNSCMTEESSAIEESTDCDSDSDSDFDFDVTDFQEKTDLNKGTPKKKVTFRCDPELCEIHPMVQWGFAYQSARRGPWEQIARDRARFEFRIKKTESEISSVLDPCHRDRIYHERFEQMEL